LTDSERSEELQQQLLQDPWEKWIKDLEQKYCQGNKINKNKETWLKHEFRNMLRRFKKFR